MLVKEKKWHGMTCLPAMETVVLAEVLQDLKRPKNPTKNKNIYHILQILKVIKEKTACIDSTIPRLALEIEKLLHIMSNSKYIISEFFWREKRIHHENSYQDRADLF